MEERVSEWKRGLVSGRGVSEWKGGLVSGRKG